MQFILCSDQSLVQRLKAVFDFVDCHMIYVICQVSVYTNLLSLIHSGGSFIAEWKDIVLFIMGKAVVKWCQCLHQDDSYLAGISEQVTGDCMRDQPNLESLRNCYVAHTFVCNFHCIFFVVGISA